MSDNWKDGDGNGDGNGDTWNPNANHYSNGAAGTDDTNWQDDNAETNGFNDGFDSGAAADTGAEAGQDGGADDGCRNCGQEGHYARECQEPRVMKCFNCSEVGHSKADCPKPRVFTGTCHTCNTEGHPASRCPSKPKLCTRCKQEGDHDTKDCKGNYYISNDDVPAMAEGLAWSKVVDASLQNDIDDFKEALRILQKSVPELTYPAIEKKLRAQHLNFYLIGLKKESGGGHTFVNLQGEPDRSFCLAIFTSPNCKRPNMAEKWPQSPEENLERLADAGIPLERGLSYCRVCENFGHSSRECEQEHAPIEPKKVICALCEEEGHRVRDCKQERKKPREPRTCKICGSEDHIAKECDQKPAFICRNCGGSDHKAADCTEPRKLICNNCSEEGHTRKECSKPVDWSKVKCRTCDQYGHASASRCAPGAAKAKEDADREKENGNAATNGATEYEEANNTTTAGGEWETSAPAQSTTAGGW